MVKYIVMKRITQILASILFVVTVIALYLAIDFVISNAQPSKIPGNRRSMHNPPDDIKISRKRSIPPWRATGPSNDTAHLSPNNTKHRSYSGKSNANPVLPVLGKGGSFHKGKTGVKVNRAPIPSEKGSREHSARNATKYVAPRVVKEGSVDQIHQ